MQKFGNIFANKLNTIFVFFAFSILLITIAYAYYQYEKETIRNEKYRELSLIAELKLKQITEWYEDELNDAEIIANNRFLTEKILNFLRKGENDKKGLSDYLNELVKEHGYENIILTGTDGGSLISANQGNEVIDDLLFTYINEAIITGSTVSTNLFRCSAHSKIHIDFISPVLNTDGAVAAAIIFRIDPARFLFPTILSWQESNKTSEALLIRKEMDHVLFLNELRYKNDAALKLKIPLSQNDAPSVMAIKGFKGIFEGKDYRGKNVLSYISPVAVLDWYIVTKIDIDEVFEKLYYRSRVIILFTGLSILFLIAVLAFTHNYNQKKTYEALLKAKEDIIFMGGMLNTAPSSIMVHDFDGNILYANEKSTQMHGYSLNEFLGLNLRDLDIPESVSQISQRMKEISENKETAFEVSHYRKDGSVFPLEIYVKLVNWKGKPTMLSIGTDISERKKAEGALRGALKEKEILLRELYHRTKNNMQVIRSLIVLQASYNPDSKAEDFVHAIEPKIEAMALVHQMLYQSKDLSKIDLKEYVKNLSNTAIKEYHMSGDRIKLNLILDSVPVLIDSALPIGLVINELFSNTLKYAFPENYRGLINVRLSQNDSGIIELQYSDNGIGVPEDFNFRNQSTLGLQTVFALIENQLKGEVNIKRRGGLHYAIRFRDNLYTTRI